MTIPTDPTLLVNILAPEPTMTTTHLADLIDLAADSIDRLAADLRGAAAPGCTSTREAIARTLLADLRDVEARMQALATAATPGSDEMHSAVAGRDRAQSWCTRGLDVAPARWGVAAGIVEQMAAYWRGVRDRLDAA